VVYNIATATTTAAAENRFVPSGYNLDGTNRFMLASNSIRRYREDMGHDW